MPGHLKAGPKSTIWTPDISGFWMVTVPDWRVLTVHHPLRLCRWLAFAGMSHWCLCRPSRPKWGGSWTACKVPLRCGAKRCKISTWSKSCWWCKRWHRRSSLFLTCRGTYRIPRPSVLWREFRLSTTRTPCKSEKNVKITVLHRSKQLVQYSGDLNSELVWYSNGPK